MLSVAKEHKQIVTQLLEVVASSTGQLEALLGRLSQAQEVWQ